MTAVAKFDFDIAFQEKIAAMTIRDLEFNNRTDGLVKPDYFENQADAALVNIVLNHYKTYRTIPDSKILIAKVKGEVGKTIREDMMDEVKESIGRIFKEDISDVDFMAEQVSTFARNQEMTQAITKSIDYLEKGDMDKIFEAVQKAMEVGLSDMEREYDFWDKADQRKDRRLALESGEIEPDSIPTGIRALDAVLKHKGWGRRELVSFMGPPKSGKSMSLGDFGIRASIQGYNVIYFSCEVSDEIIGERAEAHVSRTSMSDLAEKAEEACERVKDVGKKAGKFIIMEFPTGTLSPADVTRILNNYKAKGVLFDMVITDYADIMRPSVNYGDPIQNSKSIYVDLRAIAGVFNCAVLTATQTNRDGAKEKTAKMEHVAEDFNRVRIVDLLITINKTDEERAANEARLYFAASRNQEGDFSLRVKQDLSKMMVITKVLGVES